MNRRSPRTVEQFAGAFAIGVGCTVLVGWLLGIPILRSFLPGVAAMKANTALCFVFIGIAFWCDGRGVSRRLFAWVICGAAVSVLISVVTLGEYAFQLNVGLDELVVKDTGEALAGRMAPLTAVVFCLLAAGLLLVRGARRSSRYLAAAVLGVVVVLLGLFAVFGWMANIGIGYGWGELTTIALHTGLTFVPLGYACAARAWEGLGLRMAIRGRLLAVFLAGLAILVTISMASYKVAGRSAETVEWVRNAQVFLAQLRIVYSDVADVQAAVQSYAVSGRDTFKNAFLRSLAKLKEDQAKLHALAPADAEQQARLARLAEVERQYEQFCSKVFEVRQSGGLEAAATVVAVGPGYTMIEEIRTLIGAMERHELAPLIIRETQADRFTALTLLILPVGTFVGLGLILGVLYSLNLGIIERQQAEERLGVSLKQVEELRAALDEHAIVAMTDPHGRITFVNEKFCTISKYSREELLGNDHRIINSGYHSKGFIRNLWKTISSGKVWHGEIRNRAKDGSFYWVDTTIVPFFDDKGEPRQYIAIRADITERKTAEEDLQKLNAELEQRVEERTEELQQRQAELQSLFESLPGLYLILTPALKIVTASDAYLEATMTSRKNIVGRGLFEVFPDNPAEPGANAVANLRASLDHVLKHGEPHTMSIQKYDIRRPDGVFEERFWSPINSPVFGADRTVKYIVHRVEDVTDFVRQKMEKDGSVSFAHSENMEFEIFQSSKKVREMNRKLEEANKELESFSYSVSHDLRAPLRAVDGFSQAVIEDYGGQLPAEGQRYLRTIRESAQQMGLLIDDLLTFSRLSRAPMRRDEIDTSTLVKNALAALKSQQEGRTVNLRIGLLPVCRGDTALLKQVWINLLSNALKYTRRRDVANIEVGCRIEENRDIFFVRDNGTGFDMRYAHKLFGVFQRLHRAEEFEGTGVGLALVQRIVHRHGGSIWVEAAPDQGATFYFTIEEAIHEPYTHA